MVEGEWGPGVGFVGVRGIIGFSRRPYFRSTSLLIIYSGGNTAINGVTW